MSGQIGGSISFNRSSYWLVNLLIASQLISRVIILLCDMLFCFKNISNNAFYSLISDINFVKIRDPERILSFSWSSARDSWLVQFSGLGGLRASSLDLEPQVYMTLTWTHSAFKPPRAKNHLDILKKEWQIKMMACFSVFLHRSWKWFKISCATQTGAYSCFKLKLSSS